MTTLIEDQTSTIEHLNSLLRLAIFEEKDGSNNFKKSQLTIYNDAIKKASEHLTQAAYYSESMVRQKSQSQNLYNIMIYKLFWALEECKKAQSIIDYYWHEIVEILHRSGFNTPDKGLIIEPIEKLENFVNNFKNSFHS